jgi:hypothetical protein
MVVFFLLVKNKMGTSCLPKTPMGDLETRWMCCGGGDNDKSVLSIMYIPLDANIMHDESSAKLMSVHEVLEEMVDTHISATRAEETLVQLMRNDMKLRCESAEEMDKMVRGVLARGERRWQYIAESRQLLKIHVVNQQSSYLMSIFTKNVLPELEKNLKEVRPLLCVPTEEDIKKLASVQWIETYFSALAKETQTSIDAHIVDSNETSKMLAKEE